MNQEKVLVLGCGLRPKPYAVNLDCVPLPGVQIVLDLNCLRMEKGLVVGTIPHPEPPEVVKQMGGSIMCPDCYFDRIEAEDVLEHCDSPIAVVQECGRILKVGGRLWIRGPDCRFPEIVSADLTHKRAFAPRTFDGFCPDTFDGKTYGHYHGTIKFRMIERAKQVNMGLEFLMERL